MSKTVKHIAFLAEGDPAGPEPWFQTNYPGNAAYIHGVEHIAFGPDGCLYAGNGARGIRNAYGFCWNDRGEMFATENGPDADAPEELNFIERGRHHGFPHTFANWTNNAWVNTPPAPAGLEFTPPIPNLGPDSGFAGEPLLSFDPRSGPGGIVFLGDDFPAGYRGTFLLTRFGNFIRAPKDNVGFDVLQAKLDQNAAGRYEAHIHAVLAPLGRPIDIHLGGRGKVYICEYSRPTTSSASYALPGRILELAVKPK